MPPLRHLLPLPLLLLSTALAYTPSDPSAGAPNSDLSSSDQWGRLLGDGLWFYNAQRSGNLSESTGGAAGGNERVSWRNDSALMDGQDVGLDLSGGYYDAGDYLKCTYPLGFSLTSIAWGAIDYGEAYDKAQQADELDGMLRWGLNWMIKAHPKPSVLYVQIGNAAVDNNYWGGDSNLPDPRPSYQINETSPGTDAAAGAASAFASAAFLYSLTSSFNTSSAAFSPSSTLPSSTYSATLLQHAKDLYAFANGTAPTLYQDSVPAVADVYASSAYIDELIVAGLWLALATNDSRYYAASAYFYTSYKVQVTDKVFNWDSSFPAIPLLFTQIGLARPALATSAGIDPNVTGWQTVSETVFDAIVDGKGRAKKTPGGLLWYEGDSDSASLNPALNAAMLLRRYAPLASSSDKTTSYLAYAQDQFDYALGKNPMSAPYVVGSNPNAPTKPHSAMAAGGNDINAIDTDPVDSQHILYGAVVGGPAKDDKYFNLRSDYIQSEIALDYTAPLLTLAASSLLLTPDTPPFYTTLAAGAYQVPAGKPCDAAYPCKGKGGGGDGLSSGAIIAIVVVVVVVVLVLALLACWKWLGWFRWR